ncbi:hypothetical protein H257_12430 [Aphanomyces astaci]|uniref:Uncharacterized protein n=1 Tax=Aphanomyces astaci TaxID=112090 RepID=W4G080_APHAT|nr:hypothetical protein H257_12430 [Aphanomyces astaci]ETV72691.1 hypothetical protein H257_12430 [Aphanomyces astaci]|eukprot:XP_009837919.1 hypothetical protein H257_12430 [Aphanomyces astaci]
MSGHHDQQVRVQETEPLVPTTLHSACFFNGCINPVVVGDKCEFHRRRGKCLSTDCRNQVYARHLCVRHGGKRLCQFPGCSANARSGTLCCRHGLRSRKKQCSIDGCTKVAHARQRCVRHGGGRMCKVDACNTHARIGGYCCRHSTVPSSPPTSPRKQELNSIVVEGDTWEISPRPFDAWEGYCILDPALGCFSEMDAFVGMDDLLSDVQCVFDA